MKTLLLIISVYIINSAKAEKYTFPGNEFDTALSGQNSLKTPVKFFSLHANYGDSVILKNDKTFNHIPEVKSGNTDQPISAVNGLTGSKKVIPRAGDGGIYFFNTGGFLQPGDTGVIQAGAIYPYIYMENIHGTAAKPIVIMNSGGQVSYGRVDAYGWAVFNCTYFKITGTGDNAYFYGFKTFGTASAKFGVGISVKDGCTDYEVDHIDMDQVGNGFLCKIDPKDCSPQTYSTGWTIRNPIFHDCRIRNSTGEAMYIINTAAYVTVNDCNGNPTTIEPVMSDGAKIYNMIIDNAGWDGIQLAASPNSEIYNNVVTNYGLINMGSQQAGIILGGKTSGSVHDNYIRNGTGNGMQIFGTALTKIYNNVIVDAGFDGSSERQDALLIDDRPDPGTKYTGLQVFVMNNTIVNPGRNPMRIYNSYGTMAPGNKVQNNLLVQPNGTNSYDDQYVYLGAGLNIDTTKNIRIPVLANAKFVNTSAYDYHLLSNSPAVNSGINTSVYGVTKDRDGISRPQGTTYDVGAYEYNSGTPTPNQSPSAKAGNDVSITLPTSSTTLTATATDTDGTISTYSWVKISGPNQGTIFSPNSASTTVTGLVQGVYKYAITVIDNNGAMGKDTVQVTVNASANKAPSAQAGGDIFIVFPVNSTTLSGSGTDTDGTINSYSWAKISGPSSGTISSSNSASTLISGLVQGDYTYALTITDNNGAIGKDTVLVSVTEATTSGNIYHFSASSGNDSMTATQAQNPSTPWKTLNKLNAFLPNLKAGDSVLFKRGETFNGSIIVSISGSAKSPIIFGAYGTGAKPVIKGFTTLSGWVSAGNNIYESFNASLGTSINIVTINGAQQPQGRYPNSTAANKGYLTFETHGTNFIVDNELTSAINWTGAEAVIKPKRWILDKTVVTAHLGNKITYSPALTYSPYDKYGYFIQNHIKTLDLPGEWYYNPSTKKVSVYSMPGIFQASTVDILVSIKNQSNIVFDNLVFTGANQKAFDLYFANNIRIANCDILFSGIDGINGSSTTNFIFENSTISNTNSNAINLTYNCNNSILRKNIIRNTGIYPGLGAGNNNTYQAITTNGKNNLIEYNEIDSTGFAAIRFASGDSTIIKNNFINYFTLTKDDGGGINTGISNTATYYGQKVIGNIVLNGVGVPEGTDKPGTFLSNGIYMDVNTSNVEVTDNTVSNCGNSGLYLHNSYKLTVKNNTLFNNVNQLLLVHDNGMPTALPRNNIIRNNIFFSKTAPQTVSNISTLNDDIKLIGSVDTNYYCRPVDDNLITKASFVNSSGARVDQVFDLKSWQETYNLDKASAKTPSNVPSYIVTSKGVNKIANGTFNTNTAGLYSSSSSSWNSGKLDGGTFQASNASSTNSTYSVIIAAGVINANKNYVLKFSSQSVKDTIVNVYLRLSGTPYSKLSDTKVLKITTIRSENEFLFSLPTAAAAASIIFETKCPKLTFWLDNIELYEAQVTFTNPDEYIRFEYNATDQPKTVPLAGTYIDSRNNTFANVITLAPYSSAVLIKRPDMARPVDEPSLIDLKGSLINNVADLKWESFTQKSIRHFELQRSSDRINFTSISKVESSGFMGLSRYSRNDKNPGTSSFYRLKEVDMDGKFAYSNVVYLQNTENLSLEVMPNPTHNTLFVWIKGLENGDNIRLLILSMSGRLLRSYNLLMSSQVIPVDVSSLINGVYIIKAVAQKSSAFKQFVKM